MKYSPGTFSNSTKPNVPLPNAKVTGFNYSLDKNRPLIALEPVRNCSCGGAQEDRKWFPVPFQTFLSNRVGQLEADNPWTLSREDTYCGYSLTGNVTFSVDNRMFRTLQQNCF